MEYANCVVIIQMVAKTVNFKILKYIAPYVIRIIIIQKENVYLVILKIMFAMHAIIPVDTVLLVP